MVGILHYMCLAIALSLYVAAAEGAVDKGTCTLAQCNDAATASALMQQVQQQYQEQRTKVVASESATVAKAFSMEQKSNSEGEQRTLLDRSTAKQKVAAAILAKRRKAYKANRGDRERRSNPIPNDGLLSMLQTSSEHRGMARLAYNVAPRAHTSTHLRGWTAPLDEAGYHAVADLKSDDDMDMFIRRVIDAYDCRIVNQGGFMSVVPWFSGTTAVQSFKRLQETLLYEVLTKTGNPWLVYRNTDGTNGRNAELSFMGYVEVAATRKHPEMLDFARRACEKLGVQIVDEEGFGKMVKSFTDVDKFRDYNMLEQEISSAANKPHSWGKWKSPTNG